MDFPLNLRSRNFVSGMEEFRQVVYLLLKNEMSSFLQSYTLGSRLPIHGSENLIRYGIDQTISEIPGTTVEDCIIQMDGSVANIELVLKYKDEIEKFKFSI